MREAAKAVIDERLAQCTLEQVRIPGGEIFIMETGALERPIPRLNNRLQILSPFDNSVIQRDRLKSLFQFDYQLECYVPAAKRRYGYFCLPLLFRGAFIGRMDCKAHRKSRMLEIIALHFEQHNFEDAMVIKAWAEAIQRFCQFQNCDSITLTKVSPDSLHKDLRNAIQSREKSTYAKSEISADLPH